MGVLDVVEHLQEADLLQTHVPRFGTPIHVLQENQKGNQHLVLP
jgi:hypothetical protein